MARGPSKARTRTDGRGEKRGSKPQPEEGGAQGGERAKPAKWGHPFEDLTPSPFLDE